MVSGVSFNRHVMRRLPCRPTRRHTLAVIGVLTVIWMSYVSFSLIGRDTVRKGILGVSRYDVKAARQEVPQPLSQAQHPSQRPNSTDFPPALGRIPQDEDVVDDDIRKRHLTMKKRCQALGKWSAINYTNPTKLPNVSTQSMMLTQQNAFFCPLTKAGSTFFKRLITGLVKNGEEMSPLEIPVRDSVSRKLPIWRTLQPVEKRKSFLQGAFKAVFTRDPYWRIFSTYIDKLYSPNAYYWKEWGEKSILQGALLKEKHACGSKIPFNTFVKLILSSLWKKDMHFIPMVNMCALCKVDYDLVGKMERSISDIDYFLGKLNLSSSFQHDTNYGLDTAYDVIDDSTYDAFGTWLPKIRTCIGMPAMGKTIWRRLQIRGIIDKNFRFPFSDSEALSLTVARFREEAKSAARNSVDKTRLKQQKIDAFVEAFATVDWADLRKLQVLYDTDLYVLNYDREPASIFKAGARLKASQILDWTVPWEESETKQNK